MVKSYYSTGFRWKNWTWQTARDSKYTLENWSYFQLF